MTREVKRKSPPLEWLPEWGVAREHAVDFAFHRAVSAAVDDARWWQCTEEDAERRENAHRAWKRFVDFSNEQEPQVGRTP